VALPPCFTVLGGQPRNTPTFAAAGSADPLLFTIVNGTIARPMLFIASVAPAKLVKPITALAAVPSMIVGRRLMFFMLVFSFLFSRSHRFIIFTLNSYIQNRNLAEID
jgi:hypothetical protein